MFYVVFLMLCFFWKNKVFFWCRVWRSCCLMVVFFGNFYGWPPSSVFFWRKLFGLASLFTPFCWCFGFSVCLNWTFLGASFFLWGWPASLLRFLFVRWCFLFVFINWICFCSSKMLSLLRCSWLLLSECVPVYRSAKPQVCICFLLFFVSGNVA